MIQKCVLPGVPKHLIHIPFTFSYKCITCFVTACKTDKNECNQKLLKEAWFAMGYFSTSFCEEHVPIGFSIGEHTSPIGIAAPTSSTHILSSPSCWTQMMAVVLMGAQDLLPLVARQRMPGRPHRRWGAADAESPASHVDPRARKRAFQRFHRPAWRFHDSWAIN